MSVIFKLAFSRSSAAGVVTDGYAATDRHVLWNRAELVLRKVIKSVPGVQEFGDVVVAPVSMGLNERFKNDGRVYLEYVGDDSRKVGGLIDVENMHSNGNI